MKKRRIMAYIFDYLFIMMVVVMVGQLKILNPYYDKYVEEYDNYVSLVEKIDVDKPLSIFSNSEYINSYQQIMKYSVFVNVESIICYLLYFVGFQKWNKGQSLGKRLFKIKVVDKNNENPKIWQYLVRSGIVYNVFVSILLVINVFLLHGKIFLVTATILNILGSAFIYGCLIMCLLRKDGRGLHDLLSGTKVVEYGD